MTRTFLILGGGITGRLARIVLGAGSVLEKAGPKQAQNLTRMFGTNYLWEPLEGFACRKFDVYTTVDGKVGTIDSIKRYKRKIGKPEDIGQWGLQFEYHTQGYDFVETPSCPILYDAEVTSIDLDRREVRACGKSQDGEAPLQFCFSYTHLINTLPLNRFTELAGLGARFPLVTALKSSAIYIKVDGVKTLPDMVHVNYFSDPLIPEYRNCLRDNLRHVEYLQQPKGPSICLAPGKIRMSPLTAGLLEHLESRNVYCFGRFARWEPNELVHETFKQLQRFACTIS